MLDLLKNIVQNLGKSLGVVLLSLFKSINGIIKFANRILDRKEAREEQEKTEKENQDLKDICDNGTLEDLINAKILVFGMILTCLI